MRPTSTSIQPFDLIERSVQKRTEVSMKQPLLRFQRGEQERKKQIAYGLKDLSANWNSEEQVTRVQRLRRIIPIINPQSKLLLVWNILVELAVLFNFFMACLVVAFTQQAYLFDVNTPVGLTLNLISVIILYADVVVRFHMGFYRREKLITDRKQIFRYYIEYQFWIDLISVICVTIYMAGNMYKLCYIRLAIYLRFPTLIDIDKSIIHNLTITKYMLSFYRLLRVIIITWLFTTWAACIFFAIDYSYYLDTSSRYYQQQQLWLINSQVVDGVDIITGFPNWYIWYEYALYWSIQTSCTTGYGDLTPQNPPQVMYCNFVMLLMTVLFAYFINYVWSLIKQIQQDMQYNQNWHECRLYLKQLPIPNSHKQRIGNYMIELITDQKQIQIQNFILENISNQLKQQFYIGMRKKFYSPGLFQYLYVDDLDVAVLGQLVQVLEQVRVPKGEVLYSVGDCDWCLCYVTDGAVRLEIMGNQQDGLGEQINVDQMFGMYQFMAQKARCHSAIAQSFVKTWKLPLARLHSCLKSCNYPIIYQNFHKTMEQVQIYKKSPILKCWKCQSHHHFITQCPNACYQHQQYVPEFRDTGNVQNCFEENLRQWVRRDIGSGRGRGRKVVGGVGIRDRRIGCQVVANYGGYYPEFNLYNEE